MSYIRINTFLVVVVLFSFFSWGQEANMHQKINKDMYINFSRAFENKDFDLFASIHSDDMIRISGNGGEIKNADTYLKGYKKRWSDPSRKPTPIDFRLLERITSDSLVSDRGIYQVSYQDNQGNTKYSYGKFHVLLKLENQNWKILIDYDSNEQKTINEQSYQAAFALENYKKYWKQSNNQ